MTDLTFNIDAHLLRAAWACRATGQEAKDRPYLSGVQLERTATGGVNILATDGCAMAVFHDKRGSMSRASALLDCQFKGYDAKFRKAHTYRSDGHLVSDRLVDWPVPCRDISEEWTFPDWRRVAVPPGASMRRGWPSGSRFSMNSAVMLKVCEALRWADPAYEAKPSAEVYLAPYHWKDAVQVVFTSPTLAGYVLAMPARFDHAVMDAHFHMPEAE